jgi:hypothetical protein
LKIEDPQNIIYEDLYDHLVVAIISHGVSNKSPGFFQVYLIIEKVYFIA